MFVFSSAVQTISFTHKLSNLFCQVPVREIKRFGEIEFPLIDAYFPWVTRIYLASDQAKEIEIYSVYTSPGF